MLRDLMFAARTLRRHSLVAVMAVVTLAIGIGASTAVFSIVNALLLRPLPFHESDRLVRVVEITPAGGQFPFSAANYLDLADQRGALSGVAAFLETGGMVLSGGGDPQRIAVVPSSASLFDVLQVQPVIGRGFSADEDRAGSAARPIVIGDALWRQRFGGVPAILDRAITLDGQPFVVVGVMPPGFAFPAGAEAWIPLRADRAASRDDKDLSVVGRLTPEATFEQLRGELQTFARQLAAVHPRSNAGWSAAAVPFSDWLVAPRFQDAVWMIFAAVIALMLLACANVANLLIAHGAARAGEMRIRAALGGGRARIMRQLFTEAALLGALGTAGGVLVAAWAIAAVHAIGDGRIPRLEEVRLDGVVLAFACLAGFCSCVLFGLAPALQAARVDLRAAGDGTRHSARGRRTRQVLVVAEVAIAVLLLVAAGLLANSFVRLVRADPGFDAHDAVAMTIEIAPARYPDDRLPAFYAELLDRVRAMPGVTAAGATSTHPFQQFGFSNNVTPAERAATAPPSGLVQAGWRSITPGLLAAMGVPLVAGREFSPSDHGDAERVVIVSRQLAAQLWPGENPVGRRLYWGGTTGRTRMVIGVSGDFQDVHLGLPPPAMLLVPHAQVSVPAMTLIVRSPLEVATVAPALRQVVTDLDATLPAPAIHGVAANRATAAAGPRFNTVLVGTFAAIALVLAVTGVYTMLAFSIVERRRELAIRLAVGAVGADIVRLVLGGGLLLAGVGMAIGVTAAFTVTRVISSLLFDVTPTDPATYAAACAVLLGAAAVACYVPARRASRLDPQVILRD